MKNNNIFSFLLNPFHKIAGAKALLIGFFIWALTVFLGCKNNLIYDGVFDIHIGKVSLIQAFSSSFIAILVLILLLYVAGKIFSDSKIRFIDVAGTLTLSRTPFLLVSLIGFFPFFARLENNLTGVLINFDFTSINWGLLLCFILVSGIATIWFLLLAYNAFSVSCNLRGGKAVVIFVSTVLIAEIVSIMLLIVLKKTMLVAAFSVATFSPNEVENPERFEPINAISLEVCQLIEKENYDEIYHFFDEKMQRELPVTKIKETFDQLDERFGKIKFDKEKLENAEKNNRFSYIPCQFGNTKFKLQLTFDENNKICGLYIKK